LRTNCGPKHWRRRQGEEEVEKKYVEGVPLYKHDRMEDKTEDHNGWVRH